MSSRLKPRKPKPKGALTDRERAFVRWYVSEECNLNATAAARKAGYRGTDKSLNSMASRLLTRVKVREAVDAAMHKALKAAEITVEGVLQRIGVIGDRALADGEYSSAAKCAELHGKYLKLFTDKIEHTQTLEDVPTERLLELVKEILEANPDLARLIAGAATGGGAGGVVPGNPTTH